MTKHDATNGTHTDFVDPEEDTAVPPAKRRRGPGRPFAKGTSGNHNGRPARPSPEIDFRKVLLTELTRPVSIPGIRNKVPAIQGVVRGAIVSAVKGNSRSQHEVLQMYRQICREQEVLRDVIEAHARELGVSAQKILARLRESGIESPGNFEVIRDVAMELARENLSKRVAEAHASAAHETRSRV
jgi:hypothetical protein